MHQNDEILMPMAAMACVMMPMDCQEFHGNLLQACSIHCLSHHSALHHLSFGSDERYESVVINSAVKNMTQPWHIPGHISEFLRIQKGNERKSSKHVYHEQQWITKLPYIESGPGRSAIGS